MTNPKMKITTIIPKQVRTNMEDLFYKKENGWKNADKEKVFAFCQGYKDFLNTAKTEREFAKEAEKEAVKHGFKPLSEYSSLKAGDKVYAVNRGKGVLMAVIGSDDIERGLRIIGSHIDSPRLDLKPEPIYEDSEMSLFKTHYYGGIKKYQWTAIPLAMHGTIIKADGTPVEICIGEADDDITFTVSDLLPHLSDEQYTKKVGKAIEGEALNILIGGVPLEDEDAKEPYKAAVLKLLNEKYGIVEEDFISAEIEFVPAFDLKDLGFDRSFIAGWGQDDKVCAYTSMKAIFEIENPEKTAVCLLVDKEEIGSMGVTGMRSHFFEDIMAEICNLLKGSYSELMLKRCLASSKCLSADVCAMHDPNYPTVLDKFNAARAAHGVAIVKYTGSRGKSGASDASAEFVGEIRRLFSQNGVLWQSTELGKIDLGGGGTISQYVANLDIDTLDCGVPLLSMHSPYEIASKLDVYSAYKGYKAFYKMK